jgi:membrane-associated HD superfamily phosphohydrolase
MYQFFLDAWVALRLRFYPKTHYHYSLLIMVPVLLALGMINMANMSQLLGQQTGITAFILALTVLRWGILSKTMQVILGHYNKQPGQWYGYVLVTEALILPTIAMLYWPQALAMPGSFWLIWTMVVQAFGFVRISQQNIFKVALAYIIYFIVTSLAGGMLLFIFSTMGWLDINSMAQAFQQMLTIPASETGIR